MKIFTDASSRKLSGIAYITIDENGVEISHGKKAIDESDNNKAELCAVLFGLENSPRSSSGSILYTDSLVTLRVIYNAPNKKDSDIVKKIRIYLNKLHCKVRWVKGHGTDNSIETRMNKLVDKMAKTCRKAKEAEIVLEKRRKSQLRKKFNRQQQKTRE